jgi:hypothetical protein
LDRRTEGEIELVQFGLMRGFIGQGLSRYFLQCHRQSLELPAQPILAPYLHLGSSCGLAELLEGGVRGLQGRDDDEGSPSGSAAVVV